MEWGSCGLGDVRTVSLRFLARGHTGRLKQGFVVLRLFFVWQVLCVMCISGIMCYFALVVGCQYQCNQLPGKTRLSDDLLSVEWDVKPYTLN